jgi:glycosyltransferase involved in cell wall biosynthesis
VDQSREYIGTQPQVLFVGAADADGGAAKSMLRLFLKVKEFAPKTDLSVLVRQTSIEGVLGPLEGTKRATFRKILLVLSQWPLFRYERGTSSFFTVLGPGISRKSPLTSNKYDLLHFHWVAKSEVNFSSFCVDKPIVWTLHDAWAFTGGCHITRDCTRFRENCGVCPQLKSGSEKDVSNKNWQKKMKFAGRSHLVVVSPSNWLANSARQSSIFRNVRVEVIPNGVDVETFEPMSENSVNTTRKIPSDRPKILFGAALVSDNRKGIDLLQQCLEKVEFDCCALIFGPTVFPQITNPHVEVVNLGAIKNEKDLAYIYSQADVFVCPSREDNLPNTVMEAMACGTPAVAFDIGGLSDLIEHRKDGFLCAPFNVDELHAGIIWVLENNQNSELSDLARKKVLDKFDIRVVAKQYMDLYDSLTRTDRS